MNKTCEANKHTHYTGGPIVNGPHNYQYIGDNKAFCTLCGVAIVLKVDENE